MNDIKVVASRDVGNSIKWDKKDKGKLDVNIDPTYLEFNPDGSITLKVNNLPVIATKNENTGDITITNPDGTQLVLETTRVKIGANGNWFINGKDTGKPSRGLQGQNGVDGKSAYEIAKLNGFSGSESEWIASLKGDKGDTGAFDCTAISNFPESSWREGSHIVAQDSSGKCYRLNANGNLFTDLSLSMTVNNTRLLVGKEYEITYTITNNSIRDIGNGEFTISLPNQTGYEVTSTRIVKENVTKVVTNTEHRSYSISNIPVNGTVKIIQKILSTTTDTISILAQINPTGVDIVQENNVVSIILQSYILTDSSFVPSNDCVLVNPIYLKNSVALKMNEYPNISYKNTPRENINIDNTTNNTATNIIILEEDENFAEIQIAEASSVKVLKENFALLSVSNYIIEPIFDTDSPENYSCSINLDLRRGSTNNIYEIVHRNDRFSKDFQFEFNNNILKLYYDSSNGINSNSFLVFCNTGVNCRPQLLRITLTKRKTLSYEELPVHNIPSNLIKEEIHYKHKLKIFTRDLNERSVTIPAYIVENNSLNFRDLRLLKESNINLPEDRYDPKYGTVNKPILLGIKKYTIKLRRNTVYNFTISDKKYLNILAEQKGALSVYKEGDGIIIKTTSDVQPRDSANFENFRVVIE